MVPETSILVSVSEYGKLAMECTLAVKIQHMMKKVNWQPDEVKKIRVTVKVCTTGQ